MTSTPVNNLHYLPPEGCSEDALIQMEGIVKTFKNAAGEFVALKEVTACFFAGEFVSIVGKSGSGKSTLVNMLTGIDHPTSGSVRVKDALIHTMSENQMSLWRGRNLGIVFQFFQLLPMLTLLENVMLPMALADAFPSGEREGRARELLDRVGLGSEADKLPAAVSGGQQQSAAIARALANDPPILIADEPTGNLDSRSADEVFDLFAGLIEQGKTILMVTHDPGLAQRTTRTLLLADGELVNPWVAKAFPRLMHHQLLWLTHNLRSQTLSPGEQIGGADQPLGGLNLVVNGQLALNWAGDAGDGSAPHPTLQEQVLVKRLNPGDYLSSLEVQASGGNGFSLRAAGDEPVELLNLEEGDFRAWLEQAPGSRKLLEAAAGRRAAEWNGRAAPANDEEEA